MTDAEVDPRHKGKLEKPENQVNRKDQTRK
jgi:hypothetical protein